MEVMLGLAIPSPTDQHEASNKVKWHLNYISAYYCNVDYFQINYSQEASKIVQKQAAHTTPQNFRFNDGFDDAVSDFERALQRSKHKLPNNLPDVTAVSGLFKHININHCPMAPHFITNFVYHDWSKVNAHKAYVPCIRLYHAIRKFLLVGDLSICPSSFMKLKFNLTLIVA